MAQQNNFPPPVAWSLFAKAGSTVLVRWVFQRKLRSTFIGRRRQAQRKAWEPLL